MIDQRAVYTPGPFGDDPQDQATVSRHKLPSGRTRYSVLFRVRSNLDALAPELEHLDEWHARDKLSELLDHLDERMAAEQDAQEEGAA